MAVGLPGEAKLEASIFFTVFKVEFSTASGIVILICGFRVSISKDLMSGSHGIFVLRESSLITFIYSNRQDAREALDIAVRGQVKCHYSVRPLSDLKECVFRNFTHCGY